MSNFRSMMSLKARQVTDERREVKRLAQDLIPAAMKRIGELLQSEDEHVALKAASMVLDRAIGKPAQELQIIDTHTTTHDNIAQLPQASRIALLETALRAERTVIVDAVIVDE